MNFWIDEHDDDGDSRHAYNLALTGSALAASIVVRWIASKRT